MTLAEQMLTLQEDGLDVCTKKNNLLERLYFIAINRKKGRRRRIPPPQKKNEILEFLTEPFPSITHCGSLSHGAIYHKKPNSVPSLN